MHASDEGAGIDRSLGRVEGMLAELSHSFNDFRRDAMEYRLRSEASSVIRERVFEKHIMEDSENNQKIHTALTEVQITLERIRKPVDTFITLRRILLSITGFLVMIILILTGIGHRMLDWLK